MTSSPANSSLRANVVEAARTMAQSFNAANAGLNSAVTGAQSEASSGVSELNDLASSLATLNKRFRRHGPCQQQRGPARPTRHDPATDERADQYQHHVQR
jgi:flagellar hook-associated protein FlgK